MKPVSRKRKQNNADTRKTHTLTDNKERHSQEIDKAATSSTKKRKIETKKKGKENKLTVEIASQASVLVESQTTEKNDHKQCLSQVSVKTELTESDQENKDSELEIYQNNTNVHSFDGKAEFKKHGNEIGTADGKTLEESENANITIVTQNIGAGTKADVNTSSIISDVPTCNIILDSPIQKVATASSLQIEVSQSITRDVETTDTNVDSSIGVTGTKIKKVPHDQVAEITTNNETACPEDTVCSTTITALLNVSRAHNLEDIRHVEEDNVTFVNNNPTFYENDQLEAKENAERSYIKIQNENGIETALETDLIRKDNDHTRYDSNGRTVETEIENEPDTKSQSIDSIPTIGTDLHESKTHINEVNDDDNSFVTTLNMKSEICQKRSEVNEDSKVILDETVDDESAKIEVNTLTQTKTVDDVIETIEDNEVTQTETVDDVSEMIEDNEATQTETVDDVSEMIEDNEVTQTETVDDVSEMIEDNEVTQTETVGDVSEMIEDNEVTQTKTVGDVSEMIEDNDVTQTETVDNVIAILEDKKDALTETADHLSSMREDNKDTLKETVDDVISLNEEIEVKLEDKNNDVSAMIDEFIDKLVDDIVEPIDEDANNAPPEQGIKEHIQEDIGNDSLSSENAERVQVNNTVIDPRVPIEMDVAAYDGADKENEPTIAEGLESGMTDDKTDMETCAVTKYTGSRSGTLAENETNCAPIEGITNSQLTDIDWNSQFPTELSPQVCLTRKSSDTEKQTASNTDPGPDTNSLLKSNIMEDGSAILAGIIKEVSQLNKFVLKTKREMESSRRQRPRQSN